MPNIKGYFYADNTVAAHVSGAFTYENKGYTNLAYGGNNSAGICNFDANRSDPIYGNADTVQPPAIVLIPQIKY